jgi:hypothetical protein
MEMRTDVRNVIKRIRGIPSKPLAIADPVDIRLAEAQGDIYLWEQHEKQKEIVRDRNFAKAQEARARQLEAKAAEEERQREIEKARLKNLSKARRVLRKMREAE